MTNTNWLDANAIHALIDGNRELEPSVIRTIIDKAAEGNGLTPEEVAPLLTLTDPDLLHALFSAARQVKDRIYGKRLVLFAPMYISNLCTNNCLYCGFQAKNRTLCRKRLTMEEVAGETRAILETGHKRVLVVAGEEGTKESIDHLLEAIDTIYATRTETSDVRRINVNVAPLPVEDFKRLKAREIGTYQLFQETYDRSAYAKYHVSGKKADFDWRLSVMDRAMEAGIDDVGIGALFGLADWKFEMMAILQHCEHLQKTFGVGPHTISVPRIEPAPGTDLDALPLQPVSDEDFKKIIAILRLAVPYTGLILSTRESVDMRREAIGLGISQISAGSVTSPGGYDNEEEGESEQFAVGDHRCLDEVIFDLVRLGYIPSFCTACYRLGRTGKDFMDLAIPGEIRTHCEPNAIATFREYLDDFASEETKKAGKARIAKILDSASPVERKIAETLVRKIESGERDVLV